MLSLSRPDNALQPIWRFYKKIDKYFSKFVVHYFSYFVCIDNIEFITKNPVDVARYILQMLGARSLLKVGNVPRGWPTI